MTTMENPNSYKEKVVFTGVYIIIIYLAEKHILWHPLEPPHRGSSSEHQQYMHMQK